MSNSSIERTQSGTTTPGESDGNKWVLCIPQSSRITGAPPSDCFMLYPGYSLVGSHPSTEMQSVHSMASADSACIYTDMYIYIYIYIQVHIRIMSFPEHGFPWPSLAIRLYRPSLPAGLRDYILRPYRAVVDKF